MIGAAVRDWVRTYTARLVRRATLSATSADRADQIAGYEVDGDDPDYQQPVRRFQHYGLRSRPGPGTEVICVAPEGGTSQRCSIASEAPGIGPTDQADWEVELYARPGQRLTYDKDGNALLLVAQGKGITIQVDSGASIEIEPGGDIRIDAPGHQVNIQGGTHGAARELDAVAANSAMAGWIAGINTAITGLGGVAPPAPGTNIAFINGSSTKCLIG